MGQVPTETAALAPTAAPTSATTPEATAAATPATTPQPTAVVRPAATSVQAEATATAAPPPTAAATESGEDAQAFIIGEGSKITFTVEEELGRAPVRFDAVISSTKLSGVANLDGQPSVVTLDLHSLTSDQSYRDRYIRDRMFPDTPEAIVTVDQLPDLPQSFFDGEETTGNSAAPCKSAITSRRCCSR